MSISVIYKQNKSVKVQVYFSNAPSQGGCQSKQMQDFHLRKYIYNL